MFDVNHAQRRLSLDWQHGLFAGKQFDSYSSADIFVDPITQTAMLMPLPLTQAWRTTATGDYARLRKSDTNRNASTGWVEIQRGFDGNFFMHSFGLADLDGERLVRTTATYPRNRAFYCSYFSYNYSGDDYVQLECGWQTNTEELELRVWSSGQVEVWKNNQFLATHTLQGNRDGSQESPEQTLPNREVKLMMIPCRRRSLLVLNNQGGGFEHIFEDLDPEDDDNTITPDDAWFAAYIPLGQATFQFAPLRFRTAGTLLTPQQTLRIAPATGATVSSTAFSDQPGYGTTSVSSDVRNADNTGAFTPDGIETQYYGRVSLTGDGTASRWVYGQQITFDGETAATDDSPTAIDAYTRGWTLSVDNRSRAQVELTLHRLNALETAIPSFRQQSFLPARVSRSSVLWLDGTGTFREWTESIRDRGRTGQFTVSDMSALLETYLYRDEFALDGLTFEDAITALITYAGLDPAIVNIAPTGFNLPTQRAGSKGDFALLVQVGDSAWQWIQQLHDKFGADRLYGFRPTAAGIELFSEVWDTMTTTPKITLYARQADSVSAGNTAQDTHTWYRNFQSETIPAEANEIIVTGWDSVRQQIIRSEYLDSAAQSPITAIASRPPNWSGFPVRFGWVDNTITSQAAADSVRDYFQSRLTKPRTIATWECEMLFDVANVPVWVGDVVELNAHGSFRVTDFRVMFRANDYFIGTYTGEKLDVEPEP